MVAGSIPAGRSWDGIRQTSHTYGNVFSKVHRHWEEGDMNRSALRYTYELRDEAVEEIINSLFESAIILPSQLADMNKTLFRTGEEALMLAVLENGIKDYLGKNAQGLHDYQDSRCRRRLEKKAESWIFSNESELLFSFLNICDKLRINADYLRSGLLKKKINRGRTNVFSKLPSAFFLAEKEEANE